MTYNGTKENCKMRGMVVVMATVDETDVVQTENRRAKRISVIIIVSFLFVVIAASVGVSVVVGWNLTHPVKEPLSAFPSDVGLKFSEITFTSDGLKLDGWFAPGAQGDQRIVIFAHGYANNRSHDEPPLATAAALQKQGIASLLFDFRNSGRSEGELTSVGYFEQRDLAAAIQYALDQGYTRIGLFGLSMGGSTSLITAPKFSEVRAVVSDSAFADLRPYLEENLPVWSNLPAVPFTWLILTLMPWFTGVDIDGVRPIVGITKMEDKKILLIHTDQDNRIPSDNAAQLAQAAGSNAQLWITQSQEHVGSYSVDPKLYLEKVTAFFLEHL
jgi:fermentation-respiration switch protein FrsA (DUF1100 family)